MLVAARSFCVCLALSSVVIAADTAEIRIDAGRYDRNVVPVRTEIAEDRLGPIVRERLAAGPVALRLTTLDGSGQPTVVQADRVGTDRPKQVELTFLLPTPIAAGTTATYRLETAEPFDAARPWRIDSPTGGKELHNRDRTVFRYNTAPQSSPNYGPIQHRDAYIHPAFSPSGELITGDFSKSHPHHRGFFLAYAKAKVDDQTLDFWNIHTNKGKIHHDGLDVASAGPVAARMETRHIWADPKGNPILRERWELKAYDVPGSPYWLFDVTSTQQAVDRPVDIMPYRYGGMAYRGPEPFVKGKLDVLTAEGRHRVDGNLKETRWVDLTGPVAEGSEKYAGALIVDHPDNENHPTVVRIHPTSLPFFSFVPSSRLKVAIDPKTPKVFRYRVLIHDGRPDGTLDERVWRDFAEPPKVVVQ